MSATSASPTCRTTSSSSTSGAAAASLRSAAVSLGTCGRGPPGTLLRLAGLPRRARRIHVRRSLP
eukprot:3167796-Lingulodinium_polyedra.AAC.1